MSADNFGNIQVTEYPGKHKIIHRPNAKRPHVWDFGHDGHLIYNRTGGLPDVVAYSLMLVRDRGRARKAGAIMESLNTDNADKLAAIAAAAAGASAGRIAMEVVLPVVGLVGTALKKVNDKVLDSLHETKFIGAEERQMAELPDTINGAICDADFVFNFFDAEEDEDTKLDISDAVVDLEDQKLRINVSPPT